MHSNKQMNTNESSTAEHLIFEIFNWQLLNINNFFFLFQIYLMKIILIDKHNENKHLHTFFLTGQ